MNLAEEPAGLDDLNRRRRRAVELRLAGQSLPTIRAETGLSAPTIIAAYKAFSSGGWSAIAVKGRGRAVGVGRVLSPEQEERLRREVTGEVPQAAPLWSLAVVQARVREAFGVELNERTMQRYLQRYPRDPEAWPPR